ncbi:MAG TPA: GTPase [Tepidisphaeraceae bacterium]|nr:GTPase [Tepidisphaeraceae bacterium]
MSTNRAILLTPPGVAAIAVIRVVGPGAKDFVQAHFSKPLRVMNAVHGVFRDDVGGELDDPVIVLSNDECFADINLHGGAWVVRAVMSLAMKAGFEVVERTESPLPDDTIDGDDAIEREVAAYLPLATTELALRTLLAQERAWHDLEQNVAALPVKEIDAILTDRSLHWLLHPPRVAIVGAANVGKSTLANRLFAQERSITADVPGTTRDWVGEMANLDGLAVQLVDTPGIRPTEDAIEREAIQRSEPQIQRADCVVLALDASRPLAPDQTPLLDRFPGALRVINKVDATSAWELNEIESIHTVATSGKGVDQLIKSIRDYFECEAIDSTTARCWTERQKEWLRKRKLNIEHSTSNIQH